MSKNRLKDDETSSEFTVSIKRGGKLVPVSPHQNKNEEWELDLREGVIPGGFPFKVTLPAFYHLDILNVTTRGIRAIPEEIKNLESLTRLVLIDGDLEGFPLAVCLLTKLTRLWLSGNEKVKEIPPGACGKMKRLTVLNMDNCGLTCLPEDLDQIVDLKALMLSHNSLSHLCGCLKNMTQLKLLWLADNPFECLEDELPFDALVNVDDMDLENTNMKILPCRVGQMVNIKSMDLQRNKLKCLPREVCDLPSDATVVLDDNPISFPPLDVCCAGMPFIKSYFQSLEGDRAMKRTKRTKMIVRGQSGSGKSSLIRAIEQLLKGRLMDACVKDEDRTIGIDQHRVSLKDLDLVVLDSGGQRSYSPINQLFTSSSCLVIITADATEYTVTGELAFRRLFRPYLQRIYDYVKAAVVLPVITKADLVTHDQLQIVTTDLGIKILEFEKERQCIVDRHSQKTAGVSTERQNITIIAKKEQKGLQVFQQGCVVTHQKKCLSKIMSTSAKTAVGISNLLEYVNDLLRDRSLFPELDTLLPSSWVKSEDQLLSLGKSCSPPIRSLTATRDVIHRYGIPQENAQSLLSYLHTVGSICHFDQRPNLRQHVFLNPQFLIDLLKAVYHHQLKSTLTMDSISPSQRNHVTQLELEKMLTDLSENGIASVKLLRLIWSRFGFKEEHDNLMINLLVSFNFAYVRCDNEHVMRAVNALVEGSADDGCDDLLSLLEKHNGELLLPWFFRDENRRDLPLLCPSNQSVSVCLTYSFAVSLPEGLFPRLSARCHRHSNSTRHWLSGAHMEYAGITVDLQCDEERAEIVLSASTVDSLNACARLWLVVWRIIVDIENEIKQAPGIVHVVQRYMSASQGGIQPVQQVGARQAKVQLQKDYPAFGMNEEDPISLQLERHKTAATSAQAFVHMPLRSILSPESGKEVTERQARETAVLVDNDRALSVSRLKSALKVKEDGTVTGRSGKVRDRALRIINKWLQSSSGSCISIFRDALHEAGLEMIDAKVFGDIRDWTLSRKEHAAIRLPGISESESKRSITPGKEIVFGSRKTWKI